MKLRFDYFYKNLFVFSLVWILVDGIFRRWIFPGLSSPLFFFKYVLFGLSYFIFFLRYLHIPKPKKMFQVMIALYVIWCLLSLLNQRLSAPIIVGVIGLVIHLFFIPLSLLLPFILKTYKDLEKLIKYISYASIPLCILGISQFYLPSDHILNTYVNDEQQITNIGGFVRVTSVFSFVKIYNVYLLFSLTLLIPYILNRLSKNKSVLIHTFSCLLLIINTIMTGSRLPIALTIFNNLIIIGFVFIHYKNLRKTVIAGFLLIIFTLTIGYFTTNIIKNPVNAFMARTEMAEVKYRDDDPFTDLKTRTSDRIDIFKFSNISGWYGYGIGATYQGAESFLTKKIPVYYEEEGERIVLELGIIGGVIVLLLRLSIFIYAVQMMRKIKSSYLKLITLALTIYLLPPILTLQLTTFNYLDNFLYWFSFGLIITLSKISNAYQNTTSLIK